MRGDVDEIGRRGSRWRGEDRSRLPEVYDDGARPMLHARSLGFVHPVSGEDVNFAVDPPLDFVDVFTELSKY